MERFETFTILISRIARNIKKIKNQEMSEYNLKSIHISCLYFIYLHDGLTATQLCEKCEEDKASISRSLEYLETNDFIICNSDLNKRYNSTFHLTKYGKEVAQRISNKIDKVFEIVGGNLNDEERAFFYDCLKMVSSGLEKIANENLK